MNLHWITPVDLELKDGVTAKYVVEAATNNTRAHVIGHGHGAWWRWSIYDLRTIGGPDGAFEAFCTIAEGEAKDEAQAVAMTEAILTLQGHVVARDA